MSTFDGRSKVQMAEELPQILSTGQVAELLCMHVQMVRLAAREGRLPAYRLPGGRAYKYFRDEIFEFLKAHPAVPDDES